MWLRICVALGVFSGLPVPTGDPLASLHVVSHTWTAQPNPAWLPGGGLIGKGCPFPCISPLPLLPHVTVQTKAPAPACPRTSRETLRRWRQGIVGMGLESEDEVMCKGLVLLKRWVKTSTEDVTDGFVIVVAHSVDETIAGLISLDSICTEISNEASRAFCW